MVAMGKDFYESSAYAKETFDIANGVLGFDLQKACFEGPAEVLNQTDISQPAIYTTSIASFRSAIGEMGLIDPTAVTAYAGLSLGEYTALHLGRCVHF